MEIRNAVPGVRMTPDAMRVLDVNKDATVSGEELNLGFKQDTVSFSNGYIDAKRGETSGIRNEVPGVRMTQDAMRVLDLDYKDGAVKEYELNRGLRKNKVVINSEGEIDSISKGKDLDREVAISTARTRVANARARFSMAQNTVIFNPRTFTPKAEKQALKEASRDWDSAVSQLKAVGGCTGSDGSEPNDCFSAPQNSR